MQAYRAYRVREGMLSASRVIEADSDVVAIAEAKVFVDGCDVELWTGKRLVARFRPSHDGTVDRRN